ncbi:sel1 repeat family protein [Pelomyxa schiedti]|nr:sel1 repeat family protein [Pelomyxa schiedti]
MSLNERRSNDMDVSTSREMEDESRAYGVKLPDGYQLVTTSDTKKIPVPPVALVSPSLLSVCIPTVSREAPTRERHSTATSTSSSNSPTLPHVNSSSTSTPCVNTPSITSDTTASLVTIVAHRQKPHRRSFQALCDHNTDFMTSDFSTSLHNYGACTSALSAIPPTLTQTTSSPSTSNTLDDNFVDDFNVSSESDSDSSNSKKYTSSSSCSSQSESETPPQSTGDESLDTPEHAPQNDTDNESDDQSMDTDGSDDAFLHSVTGGGASGIGFVWITVIPLVVNLTEIELERGRLLCATSHRNLHNVKAVKTIIADGRSLLYFVTETLKSSQTLRQMLDQRKQIKLKLGTVSGLEPAVIGVQDADDSCTLRDSHQSTTENNSLDQSTDHPQTTKPQHNHSHHHRQKAPPTSGAKVNSTSSAPTESPTSSPKEAPAICDIEVEEVDENLEHAYSLMGLCNALRFLHDECKLVHGALSSDSVYLARDGGLRIANLWCTMSPSLRFVTQSIISPPEVLRGETPTSASDVWSLAILFLELLSGECLAPSQCRALYSNSITCASALPNPPPHLVTFVHTILGSRQSAWMKLISSMLHPDPLLRPSALSVLQSLICSFSPVPLQPSLALLNCPKPTSPPTADEIELRQWLHYIEVAPMRARTLMRKALQSDPNCVTAMLLLRRLYSRHPLTMQDLLPVVSCPKESLLQRALKSPRPSQVRTRVTLEQIAAREKNASCYFFLALCHKHGIGTAKSDIDAAEYYVVACSLGNAEACCNLGVCYRNGSGVGSLDEKKAAQLYRLGSELGNAEARRNLAWCYSTGTGVVKSYRIAAKHYHISAITQKNAAALCNLGWCYLQGCGVQKSKRKAVKMYERSVAQGHALAQFNLGWCYAAGIGVSRNDIMSSKLYRMAAEQGVPDAQCSLGWCFVNGTGVRYKDPQEAVRLFSKAVETSQDPLAQYSLGWCYYHGQGVKQDAVAARKLFRSAAEKGNVLAQYSHGVCHYHGIGAAKDTREAVRMFRMAAEKGYKEAQVILTQLSVKPQKD